MTRKMWLLIVIACALIAWAAGAVADESANSYVGLKKCRMCHKKEATGNQFGIWSEGPHANAFADLSSDAGKAKAAEMGVEDPATSDECLNCHTTAFGVTDEQGGIKLLTENGVTCESCHGPGSAYYKKKVMTGIAAGDMVGTEFGLLAQTEDVCLRCHKADNPGHKGEFNFEKAIAKIAHPVPEAK